MVTRKQVMETRNHLEMMKNPDFWPNLVLPLMKGGKEGLLIGDGPTVYLKNMFSPKPLSECEKIQFESFEAIVAAGWIVD